MLDSVFDFLSEVVAFHLGRFYLLILTFGRYKPKIGDTSQPLVSLFGGVLTIVLLVAVIAWINHS
jgi:hypothetical protein